MKTCKAWNEIAKSTNDPIRSEINRLTYQRSIVRQQIEESSLITLRFVPHAVGENEGLLLPGGGSLVHSPASMGTIQRNQELAASEKRLRAREIVLYKKL